MMFSCSGISNTIPIWSMESIRKKKRRKGWGIEILKGPWNVHVIHREFICSTWVKQRSCWCLDVRRLIKTEGHKPLTARQLICSIHRRCLWGLRESQQCTLLKTITTKNIICFHSLVTMLQCWIALLHLTQSGIVLRSQHFSRSRCTILYGVPRF